MPLPKPQQNEDEQEFMQRCMEDETMLSEFPDQSQRAAVCSTLWDNQGEAAFSSPAFNHIEITNEGPPGNLGMKELADMLRKEIQAVEAHEGAAQTKHLTAKVEKADGVYTIHATTNDIDRDGDIVVPSGVQNLDAYLSNNPVILFAHDYRLPAVGKAVAGRVTDQALDLDIEFADTEMGRELKYLYDNGFMSSFSIGFIPKNHKVENGVFYWTEWELLEVSAVPVPANAAANILRTAKSEGIDLPMLKSLFRDATGGASQRKPVLAATKGNGLIEAHLRRKKHMGGRYDET